MLKVISLTISLFIMVFPLEACTKSNSSSTTGMSVGLQKCRKMSEFSRGQKLLFDSLNRSYDSFIKQEGLFGKDPLIVWDSFYEILKRAVKEEMPREDMVQVISRFLQDKKHTELYGGEINQTLDYFAQKILAEIFDGDDVGNNKIYLANSLLEIARVEPRKLVIPRPNNAHDEALKMYYVIKLKSGGESIKHDLDLLPQGAPVSVSSIDALELVKKTKKFNNSLLVVYFDPTKMKIGDLSRNGPTIVEVWTKQFRYVPNLSFARAPANVGVVLIIPGESGMIHLKKENYPPSEEWELFSDSPHSLGFFYIRNEMKT